MKQLKEFYADAMKNHGLKPVYYSQLEDLDLRKPLPHPTDYELQNDNN